MSPYRHVEHKFRATLYWNHFLCKNETHNCDVTPMTFHKRPEDVRFLSKLCLFTLTMGRIFIRKGSATHWMFLRQLQDEYEPSEEVSEKWHPIVFMLIYRSYKKKQLYHLSVFSVSSHGVSPCRCWPVGLSVCRSVYLLACLMGIVLTQKHHAIPVGVSACRCVDLSVCRPVGLSTYWPVWCA